MEAITTGAAMTAVDNLSPMGDTASTSDSYERIRRRASEAEELLLGLTFGVDDEVLVNQLHCVAAMLVAIINRVAAGSGEARP